ncbi:MAG: asparaginase [Clostridia bacterium]|nr:asparaginase [Clostridia bacterium]
MKKILVILTGGTIGCDISENIINISEKSCKGIVDLYNEKYNNDSCFDVVNPFISLSENINNKKIGIIMQTIKDNLCKNYDGIIVTHGSDTLSFTSNIASVIFDNSQIPIVFIASNKALSDETGNGMTNFRNAVLVIETSCEKGVLVSYSNSIDDNTIYDAGNFCEADCFDDSFSSYDKTVYGKIVDEKFVRISNKIFQNNNKIKDVDFNFEKEVLLIKPYPGMNYENFNLDFTGAVVHYLYHSSTACIEEGRCSVIEFIKKCREKQIPFYIAPLKRKNETMYSSLEKILKGDNVKAFFDCSIEKAYAEALVEINSK